MGSRHPSPVTLARSRPRRKSNRNMPGSDIDKGSVFDKQSITPDYSSSRGEPNYEETTIIQQSIPRRIFESFKRDPGLTVTPRGAVGANGRVFDPENAATATATSPLARELKSRHLQMIAIGGSIGNFHSDILRNCLTFSRYWSFRCFRQSPRSRRTSLSIDMLLAHRDDVILHSTRAWRIGCFVPSGWILLRIFDSIY